jgi:hypothetical protein
MLGSAGLVRKTTDHRISVAPELAIEHRIRMRSAIADCNWILSLMGRGHRRPADATKTELAPEPVRSGAIE